MQNAEWVPRRVFHVLVDNGMQYVILHVETDQGFAVIQLQTSIQELHPNRIVPPNSPVGEPECNGRVETGIIKVQEKASAIRQQAEYNIQSKALDEALVMSWLVGWAVEFISKYAVGSDGRTPFERIRRKIV